MDSSEDDKIAVFVELLTQHQRRLYAFIYTFVNNSADSDDLLQQTNMVLWKKHSEFKLGTNFLSWACSIAFFEVKNFQKSKRRGRLCFSEDLLASLADLQVDRSEVHLAHSYALISCIGKLSTVNQQLIRLCYDGSHSLQEVARQLGRPAGSIYSTLSRIRISLWKCIQQTLTEGGDL